jgi:hypothetical protein
MAHQRVFDYPAQAEGQELRINAANVASIMLTVDPTWTGRWSVTILATGSYTALFDNETAARTFFELWSARVEDAL